MELYTRGRGLHTRWSSFENPTAAKGQAAQQNKGAKGAACDSLQAGETRTLLSATGSGTIRRIWMTVDSRAPQALRSLRLDMYWEGAERPAVSVPFGDFFGFVSGWTPPPFENALFASPEAKSFVSYLPMPFRTGARITITNEMDQPLDLLFYDCNFTLGDPHTEDMLYFHAAWRRERPTQLGRDFEILPKVTGEGRFLGSHLALLTNPDLTGWWGEGEAKIYLDGDTTWPTLAGTGTEDYISTGWGQGAFVNRFHGSLISDDEKRRYGFYRYHIPDPVYFHEDCRVTIQQIGGATKKEAAAMVRAGRKIQPITLYETPDGRPRFHKFLEMDTPPVLGDEEGWVNFYREDDLSAVAFFYLNKPENNLPPLAPVEQRVEGIE